MLIDGRWVDAASGKTFPVYNPATGEVMAQVAEGDKEDIDRAVQASLRQRPMARQPRPRSVPPVMAQASKKPVSYILL